MSNFEPDISPINVNKEKGFVKLEDGNAKDLSGKRKYVNAMDHFEFQDAKEKLGEEGNDGDMMFWKLDLSE